VRLAALALGVGLLLTARPIGADGGTPARLPAGARFRLGHPGFRIPRALYYADLAPDGRAIAAIDERRELRITEVSSGVAKITHRLDVMPQDRLTFAPDGRRFATTDQNNVIVWHRADGIRLATVQVRGIDRPPMWAPVVFSADGKRLAVWYGAKGNELVHVVWDVDRNALVREVTTPAADRGYVALSPDGKQLVTWAYWAPGRPVAPPKPGEDANRTITVWDADAGKVVHRITVKHLAAACRVCFSHDGKTLAVVGREVQLWDTSRWKVRCQVAGLTAGTPWPVRHAVAFSPDGKRLAILDGNGTVELRDSATGRRIGLVKGHAPGHSIRFPRNDRAVVLGGGEHIFCAWEVPSGKLLTPAPGHLANVRQVLFTADGKHLLSLDEDGALLRWDVTTGKRVAGGLMPADHAGWVRPEERLEYISPDLARAVFAVPLRESKPGPRVARVYDLRARKERFAVSRTVDMAWESNVVCSPRGTRLLLNPGVGYGNPTGARLTAVWDMMTGRRLFEFPQHDSRKNNAFFSPDDRFLVVLTGRFVPGTRQEGLAGQLWDAVTGKKLADFATAGMSGNFTAGISPDGRTLAVSSLGKQVVLLDLPAARQRLEAAPATHTPTSPVVFSPDGRLFAFGQGEHEDGRGVVQVWETVSGSIRHTFDGHARATRAVAFSPDGRLLASGSNDATVLLWDLDAIAIPAHLRAARPAVLWERLGHPDAAEAYTAVRALAARPATAVAVIGNSVKPVAAETVSPADVRRWIARLDADEFPDREEATRKLMDLGAGVEKLLREALAGSPSAEMKRRLHRILAAIKPGVTPDEVRTARAIEVLERIGTAEARGVLRQLAAGRRGHPLTEDARAALDRLQRRPARATRK
jgi:WD40 repeat protein